MGRPEISLKKKEIPTAGVSDPAPIAPSPETTRIHIHDILRGHLPEKDIDSLIGQPWVVEFFTDLLSMYSPSDIQTITADKKNGSLIITVKLEEDRTFCIHNPPSDGFEGKTDCTTTRHLISEGSIVLERAYLVRLHGTPYKSSSSRLRPPEPSESRRPRAEAFAVTAPLRPKISARDLYGINSLPARRERIFTLASAEQGVKRNPDLAKEVMKKGPTASIIDVNPMTERVLIHDRRTGQDRWAVRDDLFHPTQAGRKFIDNPDISPEDRIRNIGRSPYRCKCDDPDTAFSIACPLQNYYVQYHRRFKDIIAKIPDKDKQREEQHKVKQMAEMAWYADVMTMVAEHPYRLRWYVSNFTSEERDIFNRLRIQDGEPTLTSLHI